MLTILNLFGRSPFALLQAHMEKVGHCVHLLPKLFQAIELKDTPALEKIVDEICKTEHQADILKNDIRNHLPKGLFLAMDRGQLLEILSLQDHIADKTEDAATLTTLKELTIPPGFRNEFQIFLAKNIETFDLVNRVIHEIHELLESSFGGIEAEKVSEMIHDVATKEHEVDLLQRELLKALYRLEGEMTYGSFSLWQRIFEAVSEISNTSEKLANRIRMTLEVN